MPSNIVARHRPVHRARPALGPKKPRGRKKLGPWGQVLRSITARLHL